MKVILGTFIFSAQTALFNEVRRSVSHRYSSKDRLHQRPAYHSVGQGESSRSLPGSIYPCVSGDPKSLDELEALMDSGEPQQLIDQDGNLLGRWLIKSIDVTESILGAGGKPQQIDFDLSLARYD